MFSLGVVLFALLARSLPFNYSDGKRDMAFHMIENGRLEGLLEAWALRKRFSDDAVDLVSRLLHCAPAGRMSMAEALAHPWLRVRDAPAPASGAAMASELTSPPAPAASASAAASADAVP